MEWIFLRKTIMEIIVPVKFKLAELREDKNPGFNTNAVIYYDNEEPLAHES